MTSACDGVNRARNTSPLRPSIAAATTERACTSRPTLVRSQNTGASFTPVGKTEHETALGNPRDCVSEAPASNYSIPRVHHIRSKASLRRGSATAGMAATAGEVATAGAVAAGTATAAEAVGVARAAEAVAVATAAEAAAVATAAEAAAAAAEAEAEAT